MFDFFKSRAAGRQKLFFFVRWVRPFFLSSLLFPPLFIMAAETLSNGTPQVHEGSWSAL
jgi:hypothetical protein